MKRFKDFMLEDKEPEPILVPYMPAHGDHSKPPKDKKSVQESFFGNDAPTPEYHNPRTANSVKWANSNENHHLGQTVEDVHQKLDAPRSEFNERPHIDAVKRYTRSSLELNDYLMSKAHKTQPKYVSPSSFPIHKEHAEGIDNALKDTSLSHDLHVYHGTQKWNPGSLASQHPQRKIKFPTFTSTSIDKRKASEFAGKTIMDHPHKPIDTHRPEHGSHILHIHLKKGQKGMYVGSNSEFESEKEFLLPRKTILKVHHEPTILDNGTHVWHAHVVKR